MHGSGVVSNYLKSTSLSLSALGADRRPVSCFVVPVAKQMETLNGHRGLGSGVMTEFPSWPHGPALCC